MLVKLNGKFFAECCALATFWLCAHWLLKLALGRKKKLNEYKAHSNDRMMFE